MEHQKIVVLFPGANYSTDCPLLYYAGFKYEVLGYKKIAISYEELLKQNKLLEELIGDVRNLALMRLQHIDFSKYDDIVFVSKSLGGVVAGCIEEQLCIKARHIYLTPIKETLPYIHHKKDIIAVIAGTEDKYLNADFLKEHCRKENIYLKQIDGVGHRLEVFGNMDKNIQILGEVVKTY